MSSSLEHDRAEAQNHKYLVIRLTYQHKTIKFFSTTWHYPYERLAASIACKENFGQLVLLGFDVTAFTPAAYQRPSLERPSKEI